MSEYNIDWKKRVNELNKFIESGDYQHVFYAVRDWEITEKAELKDLAWAGCQDAYISKNDALGMIEWLNKCLDESAE